MHRRGIRCTNDLRSHVLHSNHPSTSFARAGSTLSNQSTGREIQEGATRVIAAAARSDVHGWKLPKSPRKQELRLVNAILAQAQLASPSPAIHESRDWTPSEIVEDVDAEVDKEATGSRLPRGAEVGSLIEFRIDGQAIVGIILSEVIRHDKYRVATLNSSGSVVFHSPDWITWSLPRFIGKDHISRCGSGDSLLSSPEVMARVTAIQKMRRFLKQVEDAYNGFTTRLGALYDKVSSSNKDDWSQVTVTEAMELLRLNHPDPRVVAYCVQKHLMAHPRQYLATRHKYFSTQLFHVRPRSHVERYDFVLGMFRTKDARLSSFSENVRRIVASLREQASALDHTTPSSTPTTELEFTGTDRIVIEFLIDSLHDIHSSQLNHYTSLVCALVKDCQLYQGAISSETTRQLLIDIGVFAPWQDFASRRIELGPLRLTADHSRLSAEHDAITSKSLDRIKTSVPSSSPLGPEDFYPSDLLESIRHDFGSLPVYVVDDHGAEELDDGLSIEVDPTDSNRMWLHVHVADPTILLHPSHTFSLRARELTQTMYFHHCSWPMLPSSLVREKFSLGSGLTSGSPQTVLTFSAKIDAAGNIVDYRVRAGVIRNIHILQYDEVDKAMSFAGLRPLHPFGRPDCIPNPQPPSLSQTDAENLRMLDKLVDRVVKRRLRNRNNFSYSNQTAILSVTPKPLPSSALPPSRPVVFRGFPEMSYSVFRGEESDVGSRRIISEAAKLACRVASRFATDRRMMLPRRSVGAPMAPSDSALADLVATRNERGYVNMIDVRAAHIVLPPVEVTTKPKQHWLLGLRAGEGYVKVTSPLRRYADLHAHWQIKHALLHGKPFFKTAEIQAHIDETSPREFNLNAISRAHTLFWNLLYIRRQMDHYARSREEPNPFENLVAEVSNAASFNPISATNQQEVILPALGVTAFLRLERGQKLAWRECVRVKILDISLGRNPRMQVGLK
ncbi:RNB-domain-containing protein [Artomyces pyxidatus]|uniref:RNB-domain-containing protein n=1 Tax=Artomyces pyxidatus TaxID=48021 RepID=A0ACB8SQN7_9AGAM|nr:RNB-domain-containing protein [Artomyces pyxidatus]